MTPHPTPDHASLCALVRGSGWLMGALRAARALGLRDWCVGAGAVRNLVWDHLHGYAEPSALPDLDLAYFDPDAPEGADASHQAALCAACPTAPWEVTNQAHVHRWYAARYGVSAPPFRSLSHALSTWPEPATAVGVALTGEDEVRVIAPLGLEDLFALRVQHNPALATEDAFRQRVARKRYTERWPRVRVILPP